jgi:DNA primase
VSAKFLFLPDGEDPDSMVRKHGTEAFQLDVQKAQPLSEFLFEQLSEGIDASTADGKARLSKVCAPQINRIPQGVFRQLMLEELSRRTGISADNLRDYVASHKTPQEQAANSASSAAATSARPTPSRETSHYDGLEPSAPPLNYGYPQDDDDRDYEKFDSHSEARTSKIRLSPTKFLTALLLNHPALAEHVDDTALLQRSTDVDITLFLRVLKVVQDNPSYKPSHIFAYWLGTHGNHTETKILQGLAASELYHPPKGTGRDDHQEFCDALNHVNASAFDTLPAIDKATHLLSQEVLNESEIKQLHKIRIQLGDDPSVLVLKSKIKERLVV